MNHHLNMFRFYNESAAEEFIENNLSRAFALCLQHDTLFFNHYIQSILEPADYDYLFSVFSMDTRYDVDLQVDMFSKEIENIRIVYAIAMTSDQNLDMTDFFSMPYHESKTKNITDIWITIKDIAFVIEVKRSDENCKAQLYNQVYPFLKLENKPDIKPINCSWQNVMNAMEKVLTISALLKQNSFLIADFVKLSELKYPHWFPSKPFNVIEFSTHPGSVEYLNIMKRLRHGLAKSSYELLDYNDRLGVVVNFGWASEVIPDLYVEDRKKYIGFNVWPGNTKGQGYHIYHKPLDWIKKNKLVVDGKNYELDTEYHMKFSHFSKFVSAINFSDKDTVTPVNTEENFRIRSGKYPIARWDEFEVFMDSHFKIEFDWRKAAQWEEVFKNTDRTYFTVSFGFEATVYIPYEEFTIIDKSDNDINFVGQKIKKIIESIGTIIA